MIKYSCQICKYASITELKDIICVNHESEFCCEFVTKHHICDCFKLRDEIDDF